VPIRLLQGSYKVPIRFFKVLIRFLMKFLHGSDKVSIKWVEGCHKVPIRFL